jgi:hypothetical protein
MEAGYECPTNEEVRMSDDNNPERRGEHTGTDESTVGQTGSQGDGPAFTRAEWNDLTSDPDLSRDLDYRVSAWEQFRTLDGSNQMMFLPEDEELLREDAFLVVDEASVVDLGGKC